MAHDVDVERARADTPGCALVTHLNNAGASLPPTPVLDAVVDHLRLEARMGGYEAAARQSDRVEHVYDSVAGLLGCGRDEVAVVESATRAWDLAFYGIRFEPGDRILTATAEYASNAIAFLQVARRHALEIVVVPDDEHGQVSVDALRELVDERTRVVAITHVPTHSGLVNPAVEVGRVCRDADVLYLLDACQSAGQVPLDVAAIGCDFLSATGRKYLRAPRGTGFLYVRPEAMDRVEPPFLDLHSAPWVEPHRYKMRDDARRFETWEGNVATKLGLGVAVEYARGWGIDAIAERVRTLAATLRAALGAVPGVTVHDRGVRRCGIVGFTLTGATPEMIKDHLARSRVNVSVASRTSAQYDLGPRGIESLVRASVHYYNTDEELERLVALVRAFRER